MANIIITNLKNRLPLNRPNKIIPLNAAEIEAAPTIIGDRPTNQIGKFVNPSAVVSDGTANANATPIDAAVPIPKSTAKI